MNIFDIPQRSHKELFDTLLEDPAVRIERIASYGHTSPDGFWYDQEENEWIAVLQGGAELLFENEQAPRKLNVGDTLLIPAHARHRVTKTDNPTIWLAIFFKETK